MAIFSKPVVVTHTCYELGHCWTPYCSRAGIDVAKGVFTEALKIYGTLYLVAAILKRKGLQHYVSKVVPETLQSTVFLTINGTLFLNMFCLWRKLTGVYIFSNVLLCAPPISAMSLLIEQKSRRGPLAVYVTNLAVETCFRMLVERGVVKSIAHGEVYIFSIVSAIYLYLYRKRDGLPSSTNSLFSFFLGKAEGPREIKTSDIPERTGVSLSNDVTKKTAINSSSSTSSSTSGPSEQTSIPNYEKESGKTELSASSKSLSESLPPSPSSPSLSKPSTSAVFIQNLSKGLSHVPVLNQCLQQLQQWVGGAWSWLEAWPKHNCCPHKHSCLSYITKGGLSMFAFGYSIQAVINTLTSLTTIIKHPSSIKKSLFSRTNLKLAAFLASYNAVFKAVNCLLRWIRNKDAEIHGMLAGALAGLSLRFYKSITIALYAATKLTEILYFKGIKTHGLPYIPNADIVLYAFSTAFIFHAAVMEPHTLRPGYWKFLLRVTHDRFAYMNRRLLDVFGAQSSKLYPDYWPDYDPRFSTLTSPPLS